MIWTVAQGDGIYSFEDLDPGTYRIKFANPGGFSPSPKNAGNDDTKDSDIDFLSGITDYFVLSAGENNIDVDAGFKPTTLADNPSNIIVPPNNPSSEVIRIRTQEFTSSANDRNRDVKDDSIIEINNIQETVDFEMFPNPATSIVHINLEDFIGSNIEIRLYNNIGILVKTVQFEKVEQHTHSVDLSNLGEGFYLVSLQSDNNKPITKTLVVGRL